MSEQPIQEVNEDRDITSFAAAETSLQRNVDELYNKMVELKYNGQSDSPEYKELNDKYSVAQNKLDDALGLQKYLENKENGVNNLGPINPEVDSAITELFQDDVFYNDQSSTVINVGSSRHIGDREVVRITTERKLPNGKKKKAVMELGKQEALEYIELEDVVLIEPGNDQKNQDLKSDYVPPINMAQKAELGGETTANEDLSEHTEGVVDDAITSESNNVLVGENVDDKKDNSPKVGDVVRFEHDNEVLEGKVIKFTGKGDSPYVIEVGNHVYGASEKDLTIIADKVSSTEGAVEDVGSVGSAEDDAALTAAAHRVLEGEIVEDMKPNASKTNDIKDIPTDGDVSQDSLSKVEQVKVAPMALYIGIKSYLSEEKSKRWDSLSPEKKNKYRLIGKVAAMAAAAAVAVGALYLANKGLDNASSSPQTIPSPGTEPVSSITPDNFYPDYSSASGGSPTASVYEFSDAASTATVGEGWFNTFNEMGVQSASNQQALLQEVGPKLHEMGVAYPMSGNSWGISAPGKLPEAALKLINDAAKAHNYIS